MLDATTEHAARIYLQRIAGEFDSVGAVLYGSRARGDYHPDSDADLALLLRGPKNKPMPDSWTLGGISFDVMQDTGILVQAVPIWLDDWERPEQFSNPFFIRAIRREGVSL